MPDTRNDPGSRQTPTAGDAEGLLSWFFDKDSQVMAAARNARAAEAAARASSHLDGARAHAASATRRLS